VPRGTMDRTGEPGDIEIRFREKSPLDVGDLDVVIEVRTKLFLSRIEDKQRRVDLLETASLTSRWSDSGCG
jgi:hypothetical protein